MLNEGNGYIFFYSPSSKGEERMVTYLHYTNWKLDCALTVLALILKL